MKLGKLTGDDLEACYWMGFLLADGSFYHPLFRLNFEIVDKDHLERFLSFLGIAPELMVKRKRNDNWSVSITDRSNFPILAERYDLMPSKTYNAPAVDHLRARLSDNQRMALIIGFIDGDGSIRFASRGAPQIALENHAAWHDFHGMILEDVHARASEPLLREYRRLNKRGYSCFAINKKALVRALVSFIKENDLPVMERKWDKLSYILTAPIGRRKETERRKPYNRIKQDSVLRNE